MANCNAKGALSDAEMPSFSLQEGTFWNAGGIILIYKKIRVTFLRVFYISAVASFSHARSSAEICGESLSYTVL